MAELDGIDVSHHQGDIDWAKVAENAPDLKFVMARMSHGGHGDDNLRVDKKAIQNRDGMRSAFPKTPRGFYHFLGTSQPQLQAEHFKSVVGDLLTNEFVMLDVETDEPAKVPVLPADQVVATLEAIESAFDVVPLLYIGLPYLPAAADKRLFRFPLVFPHYHPNDEAKVRKDAETKMMRPMAVWQWGSDASIPGIQGRVDSNMIIDESVFRASLKAG